MDTFDGILAKYGAFLIGAVVLGMPFFCNTHFSTALAPPGVPSETVDTR